MSIQNQTANENEYKGVLFICPTCNTKKKLNIPKKVVEKSQGITTISIPTELICEHSFQAFIDKDFAVRGYQGVDFDFSKIEYFESLQSDITQEKKVGVDIITYSLSRLIGDIILLIRVAVENNEPVGGAIYSIEGQVLYSSLPDEILLKIANEIELRKKDQFGIKKIIYVLDNSDKMFLDFLHIQNITLIIALYISPEVSIDLGSRYQNNLINSIITMNLLNSGTTVETSNFWLYSKISQKSLQTKGDEILLRSLGIKVSKSVILNLEVIKEISKHHEFEGKVYLTDRYVELMRGLSTTLQNAYEFMDKLNKMPI